MGSSTLDGIDLALFGNRVQAICDEMGVILKRSAFSPNIKDRLDFSCALFDAGGALFGQAAHIPVHLGSMAYAMAGIVARFDWLDDDVVLLNDPYLGGTHLPDVTVVMPVFVDGTLLGFAACRAHHANIGAERPGSMPVSTRLEEEGVVIAPLLVQRGGALTQDACDLFDALAGRVHATLAAYRADARLGDFFAQISACRSGVARLAALVGVFGGVNAYTTAITALNDYAERLARTAVAKIDDGVYAFADVMDDDGAGSHDVPLRVRLTIRGSAARVDFTDSGDQVPGNINCPLSVTAAAVLYVFRCLMPTATPAVSGAFRCIEIVTRPGSLLDARRPAAVAAGNVETSMRIVDVVLGALAQALPGQIPAASQGTMNNVAMGHHGVDERWDYYETIAGGSGAWAHGDGATAIHTHMTNTLNTPVESLESHYPLRVRRYALRPGSGGAGAFRGGDGVVREFEFLAPTAVTLLTERRSRGAWGLAGGAPGQPGVNLLNGRTLPAKVAVEAEAGDVLTVMTPGGGGWGKPG
jgi:N-methylhydantoinase B